MSRSNGKPTRVLAMWSGLDRTSIPFRLFEKAKRQGIWNPSDIDLSRDCEDIKVFSPAERAVFSRTTTFLHGGEVAVTRDLIPFIRLMSREGRIEDELYLTAFLWEEAKHVDFMQRVVDEVLGQPIEPESIYSDGYKQLFLEELPQALEALYTDSSRWAQARASVTYNMIVEGVLAETAYQGFAETLEWAEIMPGVREGLRLMKRDEARHIGYGVYLLSRLVAEEPDLWPRIEAHFRRLLPLALKVVTETFGPYERLPFGASVEESMAFAKSQFTKRLERIRRSADQPAESFDLASIDLQ